VFVDSSGTAYEPYSLAWRYLGMYIDCEEENEKDGDRRRLSNDNKNECTRKLLWAAVSFRVPLLALSVSNDPLTICRFWNALVFGSRVSRRWHWRISIFGPCHWSVEYDNLSYDTMCAYGLPRSPLQVPALGGLQGDGWTPRLGGAVVQTPRILSMGRGHVRYHAKLSRTLADDLL
jgi:hypothetical protein